MPKKVIKHIPIKPPAGIKKGKTVKRGGFIPMAIAAPLLAAAGVPIATMAGQQAAKGIAYGVKKIRKLIGVGLLKGNGVIRTGATRAQGGKKKAVRKIIIRV